MAPLARKQLWGWGWWIPTLGMDTPSESLPEALPEALHHLYYSTATVGPGVHAGQSPGEDLHSTSLGSSARTQLLSVCAADPRSFDPRGQTQLQCAVRRSCSSAPLPACTPPCSNTSLIDPAVSLCPVSMASICTSDAYLWERGFGLRQRRCLPTELLVPQHFGQEPDPPGCPMLQTSSWRVQAIIPVPPSAQEEQLLWTRRGCGAEHIRRRDGGCWALQMSPGVHVKALL